MNDTGSSMVRMPDLRLLTSRLELVAATVELAQAEVNNLPSLAQLLDAPRPASWPPPLNDEHSQQHFLASLQKAEASDAGWNLWCCVRREPRELVGNVGFEGSPAEGLVEMGYSMLETHQRHGSWIRHRGSASACRLGLSEPIGTKSCRRYATRPDALHSCDAEIRVRVCRRWADRGWHADNSLRIEPGTVSNACTGVKVCGTGKALSE
jgi:hypothetical protein